MLLCRTRPQVGVLAGAVVDRFAFKKCGRCGEERGLYGELLSCATSDGVMHVGLMRMMHGEAVSDSGPEHPRSYGRRAGGGRGT